MGDGRTFHLSGRKNGGMSLLSSADTDLTSWDRATALFTFQVAGVCECTSAGRAIEVVCIDVNPCLGTWSEWWLC